MVDLKRDELHASVHDPAAASMNFLNEVASRYPEAVALASGRPFDGFYEPDDVHRYLVVYLSYLRSQGHGFEEVRRLLLQYGRTNGQIHPLIARWLERDEGIRVAPEAIAVTAGCQEAMVIALRGLCATPQDVLLVAEPCYVGITGAARILGIDVVPVPESPDGVDPAAVSAVARRVRAGGRRPRALYVVPDFANPSGACLGVPTRHRLLDVAEEEDLLILEDDPYGLFGVDDRPRPRLKALDTRRRVIYLGSFAKSVFPGARVGFLVADQTVVDPAGRRTLLADELSTVKSMLTVNTAPIAQAVVGGVLVDADCSLRAANREKIAFYRRNLAVLLDALEEEFPPSMRDTFGIRWNAPAGGFFVVVHVPFRVDEALLERSAAEFGVLWTPMSFFYGDGGGEHAIRLSHSWQAPDRVREGARRLGRLVRAVV